MPSPPVAAVPPPMPSPTPRAPLRLLALLALLPVLFGACAGRRGAPPSAVRTSEVTTDDSVRLHVEVRGRRGDTLVVLHGGPGYGTASLLPDLDALAEDHVVIAYDQRGGGFSTPVTQPSRLTAEAHVRDLEVVRRHFALERMTLLGHSWGGGLAALYAMRYPDHVRRLLLVDPISPRARYVTTAWATISARADTAAVRTVPAIAEAQRTGPDPTGACRRLLAVLGPGYLYDRAALARLRGDPCVGTPEGIRNQARVSQATLGSLGNWDWRGALGGVRVPVLVVQGTADPLPIEGAREWTAALPDARLLVVERSGHFPYVERPDVFFPAARSFLRGDWPADATR